MKIAKNCKINDQPGGPSSMPPLHHNIERARTGLSSANIRSILPCVYGGSHLGSETTPCNRKLGCRCPTNIVCGRCRTTQHTRVQYELRVRVRPCNVLDGQREVVVDGAGVVDERKPEKSRFIFIYSGFETCWLGPPAPIYTPKTSVLSYTYSHRE